jgi:type I restriction enzyme S subunit
MNADNTIANDARLEKEITQGMKQLRGDAEVTSQEVSISEFCKTGSGGTPSRAKQDIYYGGSIPWVKSGELRESVITETGESITELGLSKSSAKLLPRDTLLVALYGATVGRVGMLGIEAATNQAVCYLIPDDTKVNRRYLYHALRSKVPYWLSQRVGGGQPNISQGVIKKTKIPLPPLSEQKRIAEILDRAEALRAKRCAALAFLDELTQSIFLDMFGDPAVGANAYPEALLSSLVRENDRLNYGVVQPGDDVGDGVPLVRVSDLRKGKIDCSNLKRISTSIEASYKRSRLHGDEILISCVGSVGEIALVDESQKGFNIARAVARVPLNASCNRVYLAEYLRTQHVQRYFKNQLRTVSQPTLNIKQIGETKIKLPPLAMQNDFAERTAKLGHLKLQHEGSRRELDHLFASLQHRAFRGEL